MSLGYSGLLWTDPAVGSASAAVRKRRSNIMFKSCVTRNKQLSNFTQRTPGLELHPRTPSKILGAWGAVLDTHQPITVMKAGTEIEIVKEARKKPQSTSPLQGPSKHPHLAGGLVGFSGMQWRSQEEWFKALGCICQEKRCRSCKWQWPLNETNYGLSIFSWLLLSVPTQEPGKLKWKHPLTMFRAKDPTQLH